MQQIHQQYEEVFKNSKDANEKFVAYYKDSSGALVENFNQTILALQTGYQTLDEMFEKFWKSHDNYVADSNKLLDDYLNKIKEINSTAGIEGSFADATSGWSIKLLKMLQIHLMMLLKRQAIGNLFMFLKLIAQLNVMKLQ